MEYKKVITIDSRFREKKIQITMSSDFWVNLKDNIINVISMELHDIIIPYSWYRFSEEQGNNKLVIHPGGGVPNEIYILDPGNYNTLSDICGNLKTASGIYFSSKYCLHTDQVTKKVTISSEIGCLCDGFGSGSGGAAPTFSIFPTEQPGYEKRTLAWILGFHKKTYPQTKHTGDGILLIGSDIRYRYFYLVVDDYKNIDNFIAEPLDRDKYINDFILARVIIQIQDSINTQVSFEKYTRIYDGPCDINKLHIKLIDEWGYVVNLNEMEMSLSLELSIKL